MNAAAEPIARLLMASGRGDFAAFHQLYRLCAPQLFSVLLGMLKHRDLAEAALRDCFINIWDQARHYDPGHGTAIHWLIASARAQALILLRANIPAPAATGDSAALLDPSTDRADIDLAALSTEQKQCLLQAYRNGDSYPQLAKRMQASVVSVKRWLRSGLSALY